MRIGMRMALAGWLAAMAPALPAAAQDFYKGKTITITVGFSPGGGFDLNARLLARYIGRYIPGEPFVVVINQPGAGSQTAVVRLDTNTPTDGTVINSFNFGLINDFVLQPDKTRLDFRNYAWIGSISEDVTACYIFRADGAKTIDEMKRHGHYHFGLTGVGTSEDLNTKILRRVFGVEIAQVSGYTSSADIRIAIERGELDGDCGAWSSIPEDWTKAPTFHPVSRSGSAPEGMPSDVPYVVDAAPARGARCGALSPRRQLGRASVRRVARRPRRTRPHPARGVRRDDDGPGLHRRSAASAPAALAQDRRGGGEGGRGHLRGGAGDDRRGEEDRRGIERGVRG